MLELGELRRAPQRLAAERLGVLLVDRRLERGREDVRVEDARVRVVEDRRLDAPREQRVRLAREELVERVVARDEDRQPVSRRPARPHCWRSDATVPGKPTEMAQSRRPMSIPSSSASVAVTPRSSPSTSRRSISRRCSARVAGAVRSEPARRRDVDALGREAVDQLGRLAALREADRPQTAGRELREEPRGVAERARAQPELGVEQRRVPDDDLALGARGRVAVDDGRRLAGQLERELACVRDRRRGEQELRLGVVDPRESSQPAQDVRDVRAEDAAVDVRLVDDDVAEVREDVSPAVVVREDADVEHVGVREDDVRPLADLPAPLARRVAVVDRRAETLQPELGERARLILRERLRRVEVERARLRVARDRVEDGEVEGERLPRRGSGRDDDVLAALRGLPRLGLVAVERGDAGRDERRGDPWVEVVRERLERRLSSRLDARVRDLLAFEEIAQLAASRWPRRPVSQDVSGQRPESEPSTGLDATRVGC